MSLTYNSHLRTAIRVALLALLFAGAPIRSQSPCIPGTNVHLSFPGSPPFSGGQVVTQPTNLISGLSDLTVEFWIRPTAQNAYQDVLMQSDCSGGLAWSRRPINVGISFNNVCVMFNAQPGGPPATQFVGIGSTPLPLNAWSHIAIVRTGPNVAAYVDGVLDPWGPASNIIPFPGPFFQMTQPLQIGGSDCGSEVMGGVDDLRIWNYARTQGQLQAQRLVALNGMEPGLVAYWRFDEGAGATTANSATATGAALDGALQMVNWGGAGALPSWVTAPALQTPITGYCGAYAFTPVITVVKPSPRMNAALAFDEARDNWLLFGGHVGGPGGSLSDTWTFDGTTWTQRLVSGPSARYTQMVYDRLRQEVVLFGGIDSNGTYLSDTWVWNGTSWSQRSLPPAQTPPARHGHGAAWDPSRGTVVIHGGYPGPAGYRNDTWSWNGLAWSNIANGAPSHGGAMVYDTQRNALLLICGGTTAVYELVGNTWSQTLAHPLAVFWRGGVYDARTGLSLTFGGSPGGGCGVVNDLHGYSGTSWQTLVASGTPSPREGVSMARHPASGRILVVGGRFRSAACAETYFDDVFFLDLPSPAAFTRFGSGCQGSGGAPSLAPALASLPRIGAPLQLVVTGLPQVTFPTLLFGMLGFSSSTTSFYALPYDLSFLGMPGCTQYVSFDVPFYLVNTGTPANWLISIPPLQGLLGFTFFVQAVVLDAGANAFGATVSNAGAATIGF